MKVDDKQDIILTFDPVGSRWTDNGNMRMKRSFHAVSIINIEVGCQHGITEGT